MKKTFRTFTTILALTALLLTPALPAWADGAPTPGLFGWLQGWVQTAMSWVSGEEGPMIDPNGVQGEESDVGPMIDPSGLNENEPAEEEGDVGPRIDPWG